MQQLIRKLLILVILVFIYSKGAHSQSLTSFEIEWENFRPKGKVEVKNGELHSIEIIRGTGKVSIDSLSITTNNCRVRVNVSHKPLAYGSNSTIVFLNLNKKSFSFLLRDVVNTYPIYSPYFNVAVFGENDKRTLKNLKKSLSSQELKTKLQVLNELPEVSYEDVSSETRKMSAPTWLGLSRDFRIFELSSSMSDDLMGEGFQITPMYAATPTFLSVNGQYKKLNYMFSVGRGIGVYENIKRSLKGGFLPVLEAEVFDDDIIYYSTTFTALEKSGPESLIGTDFLVAAKYSAGPNMFSIADESFIESVKEKYVDGQEETILIHRTIARNTGKVPRYAWFRSPNPGNTWYERYGFTFDIENGVSRLSDNGLAFCYSSLNGTPLTSEETAVLLQPGDSVAFEFILPHKPLPIERVVDFQKISFNKKLEEIESYWNSKLSNASKFSIPEKRIDNMLKAGLIHLDLITYGEEPNGVLAPNVGVYSPIGTESAPIIQYYLSLGLNDIAKRALNYFFEKQREDGFMQNFGGYMVETGAVLWTLGEYYRYTKDDEYIIEIKDNINRACDYLIEWRNRNKNQALKGRGYGMIEGKVADPEDHYHQFMLNGYSYLGLKRSAEILRNIDPDRADYYQQNALDWKKDIIESVFLALSKSPLVPLGDGTWSPTLPPWTEEEGLRLLFQNAKRFWSHGTFTVSDAMLGPLYLVFCEVLKPNDPISKILLEYHSEILFQGNSAFSQPYYSRHNWLQAKLGMVKPFLNTYYTTMSAHADRETYTFWEHMYKVSPHKTHEEAWFLMETRWMLYMENKDTLDLLKVIPRKWMETGKEIKIENASSYFGTLNLSASSTLDSLGKGEIIANVSLSRNKNSKLKTMTIRLPHPKELKPTQVIGGQYDSNNETIIIDSFEEKAIVQLKF